jgi:uncharacterized membrane protein YkoI
VTLIGAGIAALAALALGGAAIANATMGDDGERLTGSTLQRASSAALKATGGGRVTETEREGSSYEVEVRKADGSNVEVRLDGAFNVIAVDGDDDAGGESNEQEENESGE